MPYGTPRNDRKRKTLLAMTPFPSVIARVTEWLVAISGPCVPIVRNFQLHGIRDCLGRVSPFLVVTEREKNIPQKARRAITKRNASMTKKTILDNSFL